MRKLARRGHSLTTIEVTLNQLEKEDKLSAQRYIESYIHAYQRKLYGPQWIYMQLIQRGLNESAIKEALDSQDIDWQANMERYYLKKYKESPSDAKQRAKAKNYLYRKGYSSDLINRFLSEYAATQS